MRKRKATSPPPPGVPPPVGPSIDGLVEMVRALIGKETAELRVEMAKREEAAENLREQIRAAQRLIGSSEDDGYPLVHNLAKWVSECAALRKDWHWHANLVAQACEGTGVRPDGSFRDVLFRLGQVLRESQARAKEAEEALVALRLAHEEQAARQARFLELVPQVIAAGIPPADAARAAMEILK